MPYSIDPNGETWSDVDLCMFVRGAPKNGSRYAWWHFAKWLTYADLSRTDSLLGHALSMHEAGQGECTLERYRIRDDPATKSGERIRIFGADFDLGRVKWIATGVRLRVRVDVSPIQWPGDPGTGALLFLDPKPCAILRCLRGPWTNNNPPQRARGTQFQKKLAL